MLLQVLTGFSAISFLIFGISCFTTDYMIGEFARFQLASFRQITGFLQIIGGLALIVGKNWKWALYLGSGGLAVLMFIGLLVRIKIGDGLWRSSPAFIYMIMNLIIFLLTYNQWSSE